MRPAYADLEHHAIVQGMDFGEGLWLLTSVGVWCDFRGQGWGSAVLRRALAEADAEGITVLLSAQEQPDGPPEDQLIAWYRRHGFKPLPEGDGHEMIRLPRAT